MTRAFTTETTRCRQAQQTWMTQPIRERLRVIREFRHLLVEQADRLTAAVEADVARVPAEVIATDLLPSAAAAQFLVHRAAQILRPQRLGRPAWLWDCRDTVHRRPHGLVGLIGTWNYPVFLNVVPLMQALTAGNGVLWKPSELTPRTAETIHEMLMRSGLPTDLVLPLPATREAGPQLAEADVDLIHFTGSDAVGRRLAARLGERLVPSILELSGVDAVFVLADADARMAARAVAYGVLLNAGQTCLAPRRVFVARSVFAAFLSELRPLIAQALPATVRLPAQAEHARQLIADAGEHGAELIRSETAPTTAETVAPTVVLNATPTMRLWREAAFAPLVGVALFDTLDQAVEWHADCPFGLAASVFTASGIPAQKLAEQLRVGSVVVNDVIVPTANPATPFGGRGASGWGATQGAEGLLAMTVPQVIAVRAGRFRPHVDAALSHDPAVHDVTRGSLRFGHGRTWGERCRGLIQMIGGMRQLGRHSHDRQ
ncbi:MAG: aldehyde dehydrogenase family protein [Bacteroidales bacterium]|nr:aldehyde dehydrogenase family protein [Bacteroidales bacterium]